MPEEAGIERLIAAAERHGQDSEPDHEVGDLQSLLRRAWELMEPHQRTTLLTSSEAEEVLEHGGDGEPDADPSP